MKQNDIKEIKYKIIDLVGDSKYIENLKKYLGNQDIPLFDSLDDYLSDSHMQKDEKIKTFQGLFYDDYMSRGEVLLIITNISKKEWRKFTKNIKTFYPLKRIRLRSDYSIEKSILKIESDLNVIVDDFYNEYNEGINCDFISKNIKVCPYCRDNNVILIDDVKEIEQKTGKNITETGVYGQIGKRLKCNNCDKQITSQWEVWICGLRLIRKL